MRTEPGGGMNEVVLGQVPSLPALYRGAVLRAARRRFRGSAVRLEVPSVRHRAERIRVDPGELTAFQHLLGEPARDALPSAYVHTVAFPIAMSVLARPDFPLPLLGMVHLGSTVEQFRSISLTEQLDVVAYAEDLRPHRAGTQVDVVTEVSGEGSAVWRGRSVYLARGVRLPDAANASRKDSSGRHPAPSFVPPAPTGIWELDGGTGRRYAAVSGDWNPIHLSSVSAKALGMKRSIAHGMYLAARMVGQACPAPVDELRWSIDFATPVLLPGSVAVAFTEAPAGMPQGDRPGKQNGAHAERRADYPQDGLAPIQSLRTDVVGWSRERNRPHFTGWVERSA
ncbi:acyl dehydratase [Arthrobacter sp. CAN_A214]|uniref:MaoC family dehydratase n=1 Tax=Arthrobacter sp. CAN_A214 TaxID=2787720 RepID=UPI0018CB22A1